MAATLKRGKLLLTLLLIFSLLVSDSSIFLPRFSRPVDASEPDPSPNSNSVIGKGSENEDPYQENHLEKNPYAALLKKQQLHLDKIQELVQSLTQLVSRLESQCPSKEENSPPPEESKYPEKAGEEVNSSSKNEIFTAEEGSKEGERGKSKHTTSWPENFHLVAGVKLKSTPTCIDILPYRDSEGSSKYFAVGAKNGKLLVFSKSGAVSLEIDSDPPSPVTAVISSLSVFKNETLVSTGHENGVILIHRVWEGPTGGLLVERLGRFEKPNGPRIETLEAHQVGRRRYILATDGVGKILVLGEDGSFHGSANPGRKPIAFLKKRLLFFTENGAGSLDLRTMRLKEVECEGLNGSLVRSYVFDAVDRSKAYGLTSEGDLVHAMLLGDSRNFKCRVRFKRRLDLDSDSDRPVVAVQSIRGYLLMANEEKVFVYNVSSQHYVRASGLRLLFSAGLDELDPNEEGRLFAPLIASDHERIVLVSLGNGFVGMYRSGLPVFENSFKSIMWSSPVLFFVIFIFGAWHFFASKKEALTSWGPDERPLLDSAVRNSEKLYASGPSNDLEPRTGPAEARFRAELRYRGSQIEGAVRRETLFLNGQAVDDIR